MQHVHTPSPWTQEDNQIFGADGAVVICTVLTSDDFPCISGDTPEEEAAKRADCDLECQANADLIMAAPEMLAALRQAVNDWPDWDDDEPVNGGDMVEWFGTWIAVARAAIAKAKGREG